MSMLPFIMYTLVDEGLLEDRGGSLIAPPPCSKSLELNVSHVEMGLLTCQSIFVPINSGPPQAEATSESGGLLCKDYMDTSTYSFLCCLRHHYWWVSYPLTLISLFLLSFRLLGGLRVYRLHIVYIRCFSRGRSQTSGLDGRCPLY
jgi:hypothetical protein